ncbi:hypothetical protein [Halomonas sp. ND22Bw]|uniref:hypothetical protein n=1 Tax=Halomonas sp. ND22Bw TaxID=2054178 RepID=UPI0011B23897
MTSYSGLSFYGLEHIVLVFFALTLATYLFLKKRVFDVFFLAGGSALLFSFPLLIGAGLAGPPGWPVVDPEPELYLIFSLFYILILFFALLNDVVFSRVFLEEDKTPCSIVNITMAFAFVAWGLIFLFLIYSHGVGLLFVEKKRDLISSSGFLLPFFVWLSVVVSVLLFFYGGKWKKAVSFAVILVSLFLGFRVPLVFSFLVLGLLYGKKYGKVSLLKKFPVLIPAILVASVLLVSLAKPFYSQFKSGGMEGVEEALSSRGWVDIAFSGMEFMRTQYILNEVVLEDYSTDGGHIIRAPLSLLPVPRGLYTTPSSEFNDLFQDDLFYGHESGMAYNPFAEFYSAAGMLGIIAYILILIAGIQVVALLLRKGGVWSVFWSIVAVLLSFYFHRNSVAVTFGFVRNVFWPFFIFWFFSAFFYNILVFRKGGVFVKYNYDRLGLK